MSKLKELIAELCPNGVEYVKIGDICEVSRGRVMSKDYLKENVGEYSVYSSQTENDGELGKIATYDFDGEYLTWTTDGANAGTVFYRRGKFSVTNVCGLLKVKQKDIITKYLYYTLSIEAPKYVNKGMGNPKLMSNVMSKVKVKIPPIEIQQEIVRILDSFTSLTAELQAELQARQKQYEYYRNQLLEQNLEVQRVSLKAIVKHSCSGGTPKKSNLEYYDNGQIPWIRTQDVKFNEITEVEGRITEKAIQETSAKWIPENCVIVAISGATAGRCAINKIKAATNQHCLNMEIDETKAYYRYVFHVLCSKQTELFEKKQGARGDLNASLILALTIPLPSLEVQKQLANLLDNFDAICSDLNIGLPAEIEARQKQYEYYRDALLSFNCSHSVNVEREREH